MEKMERMERMERRGKGARRLSAGGMRYILGARRAPPPRSEPGNLVKNYQIPRIVMLRLAQNLAFSAR
jgi:hypothetical protein